MFGFRVLELVYGAYCGFMAQQAERLPGLERLSANLGQGLCAFRVQGLGVQSGLVQFVREGMLLLLGGWWLGRFGL